MSFFTSVTKTVRIDEENSVTIRLLTAEEMSRARSAAIHGEKRYAEDGSQQDVIQFDPFRFNDEVAKYSVEDWHGPGFENGNGKPMRVSPANVGKLPPKVFDIISTAAKEFNDAAAGSEEKNEE
jgi:hypothetical protein